MDAPVLNRPLWLAAADTDYAPLAGDGAFDVVVVGAGMTKGTLAGQIVSDAILGRGNERASVYDARRLDVRRSASRFARGNGGVALRFFGDRPRRRAGRDAIARLAPGEGTVVRIGPTQYAVRRADDGTLKVLSARCTHLGCIVGWSAADRA